MGSNSRNVYELKGGANKIEEVNIAIALLEEALAAVSDGGGAGGGSGQMLGLADTKAIMFSSQVTDEALVLGNDIESLNGLVIDSLTVLDGGSITIGDGSVLKIV